MNQLSGVLRLTTTIYTALIQSEKWGVNCLLTFDACLPTCFLMHRSLKQYCHVSIVRLCFWQWHSLLKRYHLLRACVRFGQFSQPYTWHALLHDWTLPLLHTASCFSLGPCLFEWHLSDQAIPDKASVWSEVVLLSWYQNLICFIHPWPQWVSVFWWQWRWSLGWEREWCWAICCFGILAYGL